jgi:hypothetical protein
MSVKIYKVSRRHVPENRPSRDSQRHEGLKYRGNIFILVVGRIWALECIIVNIWTQNCSYISGFFLQEGVLIHANLRHAERVWCVDRNGIFLIPVKESVIYILNDIRPMLAYYSIPGISVERVPNSEFPFPEWPSCSNTELTSCNKYVVYVTAYTITITTDKIHSLVVWKTLVFFTHCNCLLSNICSAL